MPLNTPRQYITTGKELFSGVGERQHGGKTMTPATNERASEEEDKANIQRAKAALETFGNDMSVIYKGK
jgi:hypothetical protein